LQQLPPIGRHDLRHNNIFALSRPSCGGRYTQRARPMSRNQDCVPHLQSG
jgi:hypothetical protein